MANTITNAQTIASRMETIQYVTLASDGTNETNTLIYDSSATATTLGIADPLSSNIISCKYATSSKTAIIKLVWDASTKVAALAMPFSNTLDMDFKCIGGLENQGSTGRTGDILLTTTGLVSGDTISIILGVRVQ